MSPVVRREQVLQGVHYPAPLATHEEVVKDAVVFWDTLRRFHFKINTTKFMVPVIGGKELDLHMLYVEVTRRGGFEKVVAEKKWREVGGVFMFSPTTSASFELRKHYSTLLYHYKQEMSSTMDLYTLKSTSDLPALFRSSFIFSGDGSVALS